MPSPTQMLTVRKESQNSQLSLSAAFQRSPLLIPPQRRLPLFEYVYPLRCEMLQASQYHQKGVQECEVRSVNNLPQEIATPSLLAEKQTESAALLQFESGCFEDLDRLNSAFLLP